MKEALMESSPLFSVLTEEQRTAISERMALEVRRAGEVIFKQGTPATALYLVKSGWARLVNDQLMVLVNLSQGSLLGEADLLSSRNYSTSAEAASDMSLWSLKDDDLKAILTAQPEIGRRLRSSLGLSEEHAVERHLRQLQLLSGLDSIQMRDVASHLRQEMFKGGETIYQRGEIGEKLYLIDEGKVEVENPNGVIDTLSDGDVFGEGAFLTGESRSTEVVALTDVEAWSLCREDFEGLVLKYPSLALNMNRLLARRLRESHQRQSALPASAAAAPMAAAMDRAASAADTAAAAADRAARAASAAAASAERQSGVLPARPEAAGAITGLSRAAQTASNWFGATSTAAKIRLIAVILLLIWLLGVAAPAAIISLLSRADGPGPSATVGQVRVEQRRPAQRIAFSDRIVSVALAADLPVDYTPTFTPWPTETPMPTATFTPTSTPTNTPIPTATFTPTPVPPTATATPRKVLASAQTTFQQSAPAAPKAVKAAVAAAAPAPSVQFKLTERRRLEPCENRGKHHIFVKVVDAGGNPVDGVTIVQVPSGQNGNVLDKAVSGIKGPGLAEFTMWKGGNYGVYVSQDGVNPASTDFAQDLNSAFTDEANCADGQGGNTLFHNSFNVVFQKTF